MSIAPHGRAEGLRLFKVLREAYAQRYAGLLRISAPQHELVLDLHDGVATLSSGASSAEELGARLEAVLHWPDAAYRLEASTSARPDQGGIPISSLLLNTVRAIRDPAYLRSVTGSAKTCFRLAADPFFRFQRLDLSPQEAYVLSRMESGCTLGDLHSISALPEEQTLRALLTFLATGMVEEASQNGTAEDPVADVRPEVGKPEQGPQGGEEESLLREVNDALARFQNVSYFEVLGVTSDSSPEEIKRRYFLLAKRYHPDKSFSARNQELSQQGTRLFLLIREAYQILSNPDARAKYVAALKKPAVARRVTEPEGPVGNQKSPVEAHILKRHGKSTVARRRFRSARLAMQRSDFTEALEHLRESVRLEPGVATYQYHLGKVLSRMPRRAMEALERLETAVRLDPTQWEFHYALSRMYRQLERTQEADKHLKQAEQLQKPAAAGQRKPKSRSVLSRLFGKSQDD